MSGSVLFDRVQLALSAAPEARNDDDLRMIMNWFKDLSRAEAKRGKVCVLGELEDAVLLELVKYSVLEQCQSGQLLIKQGNHGDVMYIILQGGCEVRVSNNENSLREGDVIQGGSKEFGDSLGVLVGSVGPGAVIGEVALVRNVMRTANVIVNPGGDACTLIRISRQLYERTLQTHLVMLEKEREEFTKGFHLVSNFGPRLRQQFIRALMKEKYYNGDIIVRQADKVDDIYFIVSGEVLLYLNTKRLVQQYELHLQAKNVYSILPEPPKPQQQQQLPPQRSRPPLSKSSSSKSSPSRAAAAAAVAARHRKQQQEPVVAWSCVSRNGMLGDFEILAQLPSRMTTAVAQTETVLFRMNLPEFRRLVIKEGRETAREARQLAKTALRYRNDARRQKLKEEWLLTASEVRFVDYIIRTIDQLAAPT